MDKLTNKLRNFVRLLTCLLGGFLAFFLLSLVTREKVFAELMMYFGGMSVGLVTGVALGIQ